MIGKILINIRLHSSEVVLKNIQCAFRVNEGHLISSQRVPLYVGVGTPIIKDRCTY